MLWVLLALAVLVLLIVFLWRRSVQENEKRAARLAKTRAQLKARRDGSAPLAEKPARKRKPGFGTRGGR